MAEPTQTARASIGARPDAAEGDKTARALPSIRAYLVLLLLVALAPMLIIGGLLVWRQFTVQQHELERTLDGSAAALSLAVDRELQSYVRMLEALSESLPLVSEDAQRFQQVATRVAARTNNVLFISMFDGRQKQIVNTAIPYGQPLPQPFFAPQSIDNGPLAPDVQSIKRAFATKQPTYSRLFNSLSLGRIIFTINIPVVRDQSVVYVLNAGVSPDLIANLFRQDGRFSGNPVAVLDPNGLVVARSADGTELTGRPSPVLQGVKLVDEGDVLHGEAADGSRRVAVKVSQLTGWQSVVSVQHSTLVQRQHDFVIAAALLLAAGLLALFSAGTLAAKIRRSVDGLEAAARESTPGPARGHRIREFAVVEKSLRALAETRDKEAQERERRAVAEVQQHQAELENRRKDIYLATLAHELRNPLSALRNALWVVTRGESDQRTTAWAHAVMERQMAQMAHLLDDLLDIARIAQGKVELRRSIVDLRSVVADAVDTARATVESSQQGIELSLPDEPAWVNGDQTRLLQVFGNLLNNAAKYGQKHGRIFVHLRREGGDAIVSVRDSGIGIAPAMLDAIFEPFAQAPQSTNRTQGGLGLGLALVKGLVELHGGHTSVHSNGVGCGAEFTVRLPVCSAPSTSPAASVDGDEVRLDGTRVLVVDDNVDNADSLAYLLRATGAEVEVAYTGQDAIMRARESSPAWAIVDIGLPDMNGFEVGKQLSTLSSPPRLIALSGWGSDDDRRKSAAAGFEMHLVKPVKPAVIVQTLLVRDAMHSSQPLRAPRTSV